MSVFVGQFCSPLLSTSAILAFDYSALFRGAAAFLMLMVFAIWAVMGDGRLRSAFREPLETP